MTGESVTVMCMTGGSAAEVSVVGSGVGGLLSGSSTLTSVTKWNETHITIIIYLFIFLKEQPVCVCACMKSDLCPDWRWA